MLINSNVVLSCFLTNINVTVFVIRYYDQLLAIENKLPISEDQASIFGHTHIDCYMIS